MTPKHAAPNRWRIDGSVRRLDGGRVLLGGSPLRLLRLSASGANAFDALTTGTTGAASTTDAGPAALVNGSAVSRLVRRLTDAGVLHPVAVAGEGPFTTADVTVVIPVHGTDIDALLTQIGPVAHVIVVDDGSSAPLLVAPPEGSAPVTLVRRGAAGGPGLARDHGLARVTTPLVAFVDADVALPDDWLDLLLPHFGDDDVAAIAPRVLSTPGPGALARYETSRSPLDLGPVPGRVRAGTRVSYVPAACLVARTAALHEAGGFAPALRYGEDVDLVWRLDAAGWTVRYEPAVVILHEPRPTVAAWLHQRFSYGSSAAPLAARHPGALAPVRLSGWSAAAWGLAAAGAPAGGLGVAAMTTGLLARKLRGLDHPLREAGRLAGLGHLFAGRLLAATITRTWWPFALVAAVMSRRARRVMALAVLVPPLVEWLQLQPPRLDPVRYLGLRVADDVAYGAGVWAGCARQRTIAPLVPDLTSWPNERRRRPQGPGGDSSVRKRWRNRAGSSWRSPGM